MAKMKLSNLQINLVIFFSIVTSILISTLIWDKISLPLNNITGTTGALVEKKHKWSKASTTISTVCNYCPVGCSIDLEVDAKQKIIRTKSQVNSPANHGQLCFKGKFGMEFINNQNRLKRPLIKAREGFIETDWDETVSYLSNKLR